MIEPGYLRIGELARRTGASPELLRAWERRYGLLRPTRSQGGFRLYTAADEERIRRMKEYLARGVAAAEAARLAADAETPRSSADTTTPAIPAPETTAAAPPPLQAAARELAGALDRFDEEQTHAVLDRLLAAYRIETILRDLLVPYLHNLGERWAGGEVSVAQEHFASNLLRGRLLGLARGWGQGHGPTAVLACLPGEQHDLGLIAFGITLYRRGWRIIYLGPTRRSPPSAKPPSASRPTWSSWPAPFPSPLPPTPMPSPTSPGRPRWPSAAPARPRNWPPGPERTCWTRTRSARPSIWTATSPDRGTHPRHLAQPEPANN